MKLYLSVIGVAVATISTVNAILGVAPWHYAVIATVFCTALQFALDGLIAIVINKMPDGWFGVDNALYRVSDRERVLYKKLKVRCWKDKVWELGGLGGFSKKALREPNNPAYIEKFIDKELSVIFETIDENNNLVGHSSNYIKVIAKGTNNDLNTIKKVKITSFLDGQAFGIIL